MQERRKRNRRKRMVRNLFSYLNRRDLFRKGRRKDEEEYPAGPDWVDQEHNKAR